MTATAIAKVLRLSGALALVALCAACAAAMEDPAGFTVVSQDKYDFMTCPEIIGNRNNLTARDKELNKLVEKANAEPGGIVVSALAYRSELVHNRAMMHAAERAAVKNSCDTKPKPKP
jgi:hypothetical protein